jgi:alkanesulfonate monooxygenase SsuD/methylene tetrahydromethanopterin reductase-like flavin-dependent oxidoreductase (luciferase family)
MEFMLFLPQMRLSFDALVGRAQAAEAAGFTGIVGMDHMAPPMAEDQPMYEAMITNAWVAANTERLKVGSLVLCDSFRHPAVLAREAVSIDHASGGRFELGIGWGSLPSELTSFGVGSAEPADRVARLRETLEVLQALWTGELVEYDGAFHQLHSVQQLPQPLSRIPIVIGGVGPKTLSLVRDFADWWNLDVRSIDRVEELRAQVGSARVSIQQMVAFVGRDHDRDEVAEVAARRFRGAGPVVGSDAELIEHFGELADSGVERVYAWFTDFAQPEGLEEFGETVIAQLG